MGKLAVFMAMKRDMAFDFEHELRSVRDLILGVQRLSGKELTLDISSPEGYVAGTRARAQFVKALHAHLHELLVQYAHDLARREPRARSSPGSVGGSAWAERCSLPRGEASRSGSEGSHVRLAAV